MEQIQDFEDVAGREAIADLIYRYASRIDAGDIDGVLACFAENCAAAYGNGAVTLNGKAELRSFFIKALDTDGGNSTASSHFMTNVLVTLRGAEAEAETTAMAVRNISPGKVTVRGLIYRDVLARAGGTWLIRRREHVTIWEFETPGRFLAGLKPGAPQGRS